MKGRKEIYPDEQYILSVKDAGVATIRDIAKTLNMSMTNTTLRLHKLVDEGKLKKERVATTWNFTLNTNAHNHAQGE